MAARTVLFAHSSSERYGADRQMLAHAAGLDRSRYEPLVVLPDHGTLAAELRAHGVEVRVRPLAVLRRALFSPSGLASVAGALAADAAALGRLARERDVALVHSNTSVTLGGAAAATAARVPHVWHVREIYTDFARWWPSYRRMLLCAAALPCISVPTLEQFAGSPKARLIHEGLPFGAAERRPADRAAARASLGLPEDAFVALFLGRLNSWKGQEVLVRALAEPELAGRGAFGLIAGSAWPGAEHYEHSLREEIESLGLGERVHMLGFRDDLEVLYGAADVVVVPSTNPEPLCNAALEATAAGCCVVAAAHGGLPEIVRDGETGELVPPGDPSALARALAGLAAEPGRAAQLGAAAAADVRERFATSLMLERTQALYDEVLEGR